MRIIPAIDLLGGNCVRLCRGKIEEETVYSRDPVFVAKLWRAKGASWLHIVDLDGAFKGNLQNIQIIRQIKQLTGLPVQLGGGVRDLTLIQRLLEKEGIERVILGTVSMHNPGLLQNVLSQYGARILVSVDVVDDKVAIGGWKEVTPITVSEHLRRLVDYGIEEIIFTDISRDGTLSGINIERIEEFLAACPIKVIISGGVTSLEDLEKLKRLNSRAISGVIIGKALYAGNIDLQEAISIFEKEETKEKPKGKE